MESLAGVTGWISENEALLSGLAALIVVAGVVFTPLGVGVRRLLRNAAGRATREPAAGAGEARGEAPGPAPAASNRPSIAVLPFDSLSGDPEHEHLADGITEDIITGLSASRHLSVVSRNSSFAYKGRSPDIRQVGRELGARYVLEGSVRRVGERVRTTAQLIEAESGSHLWAEKYDRAAAELSETQDEVVTSITGQLVSQLGAAEYQRARSGASGELGAWGLVQRGLGSIVYISPSAASIRSICRDLEAALELDPGYAYAHSALAWMHYNSIVNGYVDDMQGAADAAREHLRIALEGFTEDPLTLYYAGAAYLYSGRQEDAIRLLERSLQRNPAQAEVHMHLGLAHGLLGHFEEAHRSFDAAEAMAPNYKVGFGWYRSMVLGFEGRYEEAIALIRPYLEVAPRYATARLELALDFEALGRHREAHRALEQALVADPEVRLEGLALLFAAHPDAEEGARRVAWLREHWPRTA